MSGGKGFPVKSEKAKGDRTFTTFYSFTHSIDIYLLAIMCPDARA
jgi:hypothetical protein